jgi:hypothetical protein
VNLELTDKGKEIFTPATKLKKQASNISKGSKNLNKSKDVKSEECDPKYTKFQQYLSP